MENITTLGDYQILELKSTNKTPGVLGTVRGEFFYEDVASRNKRIYPQGTWEKALSKPNFIQAMDARLVLGTVGHADINADTLIRERKVSHRTTKLALNKDTKIGMGEAEILDTPVGRVLFTILKTGSKMAVSSKAWGDYTGKDNQGNDIVDKDKFVLERFDFVTDPGYLTARPELKEQLEEAYKQITSDNNDTNGTENHNGKTVDNFNSGNFNNGGNDMEIVEKVMKEKAGLENEVSLLSEQLNTKAAEVSGFTKDIEAYKEKVKELESANADLVLAADKCNEFFTEYGKPEDIKQSIDNSLSVMEQLKELGSIEDIKELTNVFEQQSNCLAELGTIEEIEGALEASESLVERIAALGSIDSIEQALDASEAYITSSRIRNNEQVATHLSAKYGVAETKIKSMLEDSKLSSAQVEGILNDLKQGTIPGGNSTAVDEGNEYDEDLPSNGKSRTRRMIESLTT